MRPAGRIDYTAGEVQPKYLINSDNFKAGYVTTDDHWDNYWRKGANQLLGLEQRAHGQRHRRQEHGPGARATATPSPQCQVKKVFKAVCFREPGNAADRAEVGRDQEQRSSAAATR